MSLLRKLLLSLAAAMLLAGLSDVALAQKSRKPSPPKFQLQYFNVPGRGALMSAADINNLGQVVGYYEDSVGHLRAFFYDPAISATTAMDLEAMIDGAGVPTGWRLTHARSINDGGIILGEMAGSDPETGEPVRWGFVLDTLSTEPAVIPLPDIPGVDEFSRLRPVDINNNGDILCYYSANGALWNVVFNPFLQSGPWFLDQPVWGSYSNKIGNATASSGAIVGIRLADGTLARWIPESDLLVNLGVGSNVMCVDINDAGYMVGSYNNSPMRLITPPPKTFNVGVQLTNWASGINNSNDVSISSGYLYRDDIGLVNLSSYLSGTTVDRTLWSNAALKGLGKIADRNVTSKYGQMIGTLSIRNADGTLYYQPYLLTPIAPTKR
ncbi:MAG: hypothetical protein KDA91_25055 [Planctomycetaceae bacterium]|nr:hypothetical protein [Planctomycetaceae bacterium]